MNLCIKSSESNKVSMVEVGVSTYTDCLLARCTTHVTAQRITNPSKSNLELNTSSVPQLRRSQQRDRRDVRTTIFYNASSVGHVRREGRALLLYRLRTFIGFAAISRMYIDTTPMDETVPAPPTWKSPRRIQKVNVSRHLSNVGCPQGIPNLFRPGSPPLVRNLDLLRKHSLKRREPEMLSAGCLPYAIAIC